MRPPSSDVAIPFSVTSTSTRARSLARRTECSSACGTPPTRLCRHSPCRSRQESVGTDALAGVGLHANEVVVGRHVEPVQLGRLPPARAAILPASRSDLLG